MQQIKTDAMYRAISTIRFHQLYRSTDIKRLHGHSLQQVDKKRGYRADMMDACLTDQFDHVTLFLSGLSDLLNYPPKLNNCMQDNRIPKYCQ